jgi:cell division protein FtsN
MERNRVLWVIFSVSLFLVVVLAAGLYFLRPKPQAGAEAALRQTPSVESFDAFEYVRGRSGLPGLEEQAPQAEEMVIIVGDSGEPAGATPAGEDEIPVAREIVPSSSPPASQPSTGAAAVERPGREAAPRARSVPPPAPRPASTPRPKPLPQPVRVTEYWIQVGSFSSRSRADDLRESLEEKGLAPRITTRLVGGASHFRVRLGPYPNRAEADKFLEWVKALEGLQGSYVSMVTVQRPKP